MRNIMLLISLFCLNVTAQNVCVPLIQKNFAMPDTLFETFRAMSLTFTPPVDDFDSNTGGQNFYNLPHLYRLHGTMYALESKDSEFFCCVFAKFIDNDAVMTRCEAKTNVAHDIIVTKRFPTQQSANLSLIKDISPFVSYYSPEKAKEIFNADTVICYSIDMYGLNLSMNSRRNKLFNYSENKVLLLQKNDRGFIALYCFYTKKGQKKLKKYMRLIENTFWFIDYCPTGSDEIKIVPVIR